MYKVSIKKKAEKTASKMPMQEQLGLVDLIEDLRHIGPAQPAWKNYSILDRKGRRHHCHLSYHWVACWQETVKGIEIEVYYAGSRESAPY